MTLGRPSKYKPEYDRIAKSMCLLGATDEEVAAALDIGTTTIERWKRRHKTFRAALKAGKTPADGNVAMSLYQRACGYEKESVKIFADAKTGASLLVPYTEWFPPDTTACIYWLKNRRPDLWRERRVEAGDDTTPTEKAQAIRSALTEMEDASGGAV